MARRTGVLHLVPLNIPVERGMIFRIEGDRTELDPLYQWGQDEHGTLYLVYRHPYPYAGRPRLSVADPNWDVYNALRYVEWVGATR